MPSDVPRARYLLPKFTRGSYAVLMKNINNSLIFDAHDAVKFRVHVLNVYYQYGWKAVTDSFKISKSILYLWKKNYEVSGKRPYSLIPKSTRPNVLRDMKTDTRIVAFIRALREQYGNISKYKIKPFLDEYAKTTGITPVSTTTIGKIIKRKRLFFDSKRVCRKRHKLSVLRLKYAPREKQPGYLEMDSITLYVLGSRFYFSTIIDVVTKYAICRRVSSLSAVQSLSVFNEFTKSYTYPIRTIQTDNGHEFLGDFHIYLESQNIKHEFIYPRSPRINGVVERFNRTIQEEFINRTDEISFDLSVFNEKLISYLLWYNTKRPHYSLGFKTPMDYMKQFNDFPISG